MSASSILPAGGDTATPLNLRKRLDALREVAAPLAGKRIVDCGCGGGEYVRTLRSAGAAAFGIEYQRAKARSAPPSAAGGAPAICVADVGGMPFADRVFDLALLNEVLEHVPDDSASLREVRRVLAADGALVVFSPNRLYPFETHGVFLRRSNRRVPHYLPLIPWVPLPLGRIFFRYWARNYWPWELPRLVRRAGFDVVETFFVWQTFENISGRQPAIVRALSPLLRRITEALEKTPLLRCFGASQAIVARPRVSDGGIRKTTADSPATGRRP